MRKKMKKISCIILAIFLCFTTTVPTMAASSVYNAAVASYMNYMKGKSGYYKIIDVDGNGIPELLMNNRTQGYCYNEIRTYNPRTRRNRNVAVIGYGKGYNMSFRVSKTCHTVMLPNGNTGGMSYTIFKISGTSARKIVQAEKFNGKFEKGYAINGKKVSKSKYDNTIAKYMKNSIEVKIK